MEMPKKTGIIFVTLGVVLFASALLLSLYNRFEDRHAGQQAELLMNEIQSVISEEMYTMTEQTEIEPDVTEPQETLSDEMPIVLIDGYTYIGFLAIPDLELELPVMADWDYSRLQIAPCRHFGSSRTDDLVIAAHNYKTHFGALSSLEAGTEVTFTDMDGIVNRYALVGTPETLAPEAVDAVQNSGHDLVLYTCTTGGATRVVVFCDRVADQENEEE